MSRFRWALLPAMLCSLLSLSCGPRRISASWELGSESKVELRQDSTAEALLRVRFNETWEQLPPGQRYLKELEGKRLSGWDYMGDKKPCTVSLPAGNGFSELCSASASPKPQYVELEEVRRMGEARTFLRLSACEFWEKIMMTFGGVRPVNPGRGMRAELDGGEVLGQDIWPARAATQRLGSRSSSRFLGKR